MSSVLASAPAAANERPPIARALFRKELRSYLVSPIPYLLAAVFAGVTAFVVFEREYFLVLRQANLQAMFEFFPWAFLVLVPAIAMRLWSEEIRGGTVETLMTFPARSTQLVAGKFAAALVVLAGCLVFTAALPVTAALLGDLDPGPVVGGYVGALLLGGTFLALGLWLSALTRNQIVAFLLALVGCFAFAMLDLVASGMEGGALANVLDTLAVRSHYRSMTRGVVDLRDVAYFASAIGFFLYLTVQSVENRRHR